MLESNDQIPVGLNNFVYHSSVALVTRYTQDVKIDNLLNFIILWSPVVHIGVKMIDERPLGIKGMGPRFDEFSKDGYLVLQIL